MTQIDYFLKIDGVEGESTDATHAHEIEILSFCWGETNSGSVSHGGGGGAGKVQPQPFHFVKRVDVSSPKLFIACATGQHFSSAVLTGRKAGGSAQDYLRLRLEDVLVSAYEIEGGGATGTLPEDRVNLTFAKLEFGYKRQKADGTLDAEIKQKFNFAANRPE